MLYRELPKRDIICNVNMNNSATEKKLLQFPTHFIGPFILETFYNYENS